MGKKDKPEKEQNGKQKDKKKEYLLTIWTKKWIKAISMFVVAIIVILSFLDKGGGAGKAFKWFSQFLIGGAIYALPIFLVLGGIILLKTKRKTKAITMVLSIVVALIGIAGILASQNLDAMNGGWIGFLLGKLIAGS